MGSYTRFETKQIELRKDTPEDVIAFIDSCVNSDTPFKEVRCPDHKLFSLKRWSHLFGISAFTKTKTSFVKKEKGNYVFQIGACINYGYEEVAEFVKWIAPYVAGHKPKEFIGMKESEDDDKQSPVYILRSVKMEI